MTDNTTPTPRCEYSTRSGRRCSAESTVKTGSHGHLCDMHHATTTQHNHKGATS